MNGSTRVRAALASMRVNVRAPLKVTQPDRVAIGNQLLLCAIVAVLFVIGIITGGLIKPGLFAFGTLGISLLGVAALAVPWARVSPGWIVLIPLGDIFAIAVLRLSDPVGGLGLLWAFPAMWLASLGWLGFVASCTIIPAVYWAVLVFGPSPSITFAALLLPLVIVAISAAGHASARRFAAQRELLKGQAAGLAFARSAAVRQEQLVTEAFDAVDFGVVRLSVGGDVVYENDAVGRLSREIPGLHAATVPPILLEEDARTPLPLHDHPLARVRRGEMFEDEVVWSEDAEGHRTALMFTARRLIDHRGADSGAVLVTREVTAERDALRARDDLVASVSHELRTPLTSVLGYLELALDEEDLPPRAHRYVETALGSGERLLAIVADILTASRASRQSMEAVIHPRAIDVVEVARASIVGLRPLAADRVIKLTLSGVDRAVAFADSGRLRQVIDNLLSNAIKFNRDGGIVEVIVGTSSATTTIAVRDTGIGIGAADQEHVFERFFRVSEDAAGNGLGLAISNDIVAAHDGRLTVESEFGVGSTFTITLPAHEEGAVQ